MGGRAVLVLIGLVPAVLLTSCRPAAQTQPAADPYAQDWAVDPAIPGPDSPPSGHSLFDALVADPVPFPFSRLLESISDTIGPRVEPRRILIPLGRSLQRSAGAPDFFRYPRAVAAYDSERPSDRVFVKDRLFLGYHEKAAVIEVISYNSDAGRFEFQLVKNYRDGASPQVFYARRAVCTTCHQNHGPLFPRQLWDETNSNSRVSSLLLAEHHEYYGFPIQQSADVPYAIDLAVHRANEFSACQAAWRASNAELRRQLLKAILRCRLSGSCESPEVASPLGALWQQTWPRGMRLPNPEIANRNPLAILSREGPSDRAGATAFLAARQEFIDAHFEPGVRRRPLDIWPGDAGHVDRIVADLATFFTIGEIARLDDALARSGGQRVEYRSGCKIDGEEPARVAIRCESTSREGFALSGRLHLPGGKAAGSIAWLRLDGGGVVRDLGVASGKAATTRGGLDGSIGLRREEAGLTARTGDGNRIDRIRFDGRDAVLECSRDFDRLAGAIDALDGSGTLGGPVLRAGPILRELYSSLGWRPPQLPDAPAAARRPVLESGTRSSSR
jgi:hypothetical protein